jgi:two-component system response regulator RegX3
MNERVVVVDDDPTILESVEYTLRADGMDVTALNTARAAMQAAARDEDDLFVLDLGLPDGSGLEVCRAIRSASTVPILILTARDTEVDVVLGLEAGADDYVVKPFSLAVLRGRVRALLRRRELDRKAAGETTIRRIGNLSVDMVRHVAHVDGRSLQLTRSEFKLMALLSQQPERVFTRRQIMEHLWDSTYVGDLRACDVHISALRRKIDTPGHPSRITTVRGVGYKLIPV